MASVQAFQLSCYHCKIKVLYLCSEFFFFYINRINQYLSNRIHIVKINNDCSEWQNLTCGILQRIVLEPLIFVIYKNQLPDTCKEYCVLYLFTDDAKMSRSIKNKTATNSL